MSMKRFIRDSLIIIVITLVVFLGLQATVQSTVVSGSSMEPNFENGQRLIINKFIYRFDEIERGDVVIFHPPSDTNVEYIKRVIGLPGETVEIRNRLVYINGELLSESYIPDPPLYFMEEIEIPHGHYFVLGDNRNKSDDSHVWGPVPEGNIIGKVWFSIWPLW